MRERDDNQILVATCRRTPDGRPASTAACRRRLPRVEAQPTRRRPAPSLHRRCHRPCAQRRRPPRCADASRPAAAATRPGNFRSATAPALRTPRTRAQASSGQVRHVGILVHMRDVLRRPGRGRAAGRRGQPAPPRCRRSTAGAVQRARDSERALGRVVVAEIPAEDDLVLFTEDTCASTTATRSMDKDLIAAVRVLINGAPIAVAVSRRHSRRARSQSTSFEDGPRASRAIGGTSRSKRSPA